MEDQDIQDLVSSRQFIEAFSALVERFKEKVFRLAFSILRNETQAEDVAQDVFVKIWKGLPGYHGGASLSTWVYAITRNTCLTELKRRERRAAISLEELELAGGSHLLPAAPPPELEPGAQEEVAGLLDQLPEKYRQVITLFYFEQKAYEEVALMLGLPIGTVKTLLFRAKKQLLQLSERPPRPRPLPAARPATGKVSKGAAGLSFELRRLKLVLG